MQTEAGSRALKKRIAEYYRQRIQDDDFERHLNYGAVTFRPGGHLDSFAGNEIRRAGTAVLFTLRYEMNRGKGRILTEVLGANTRADGTVVRARRNRRLAVDLRSRPRPGARGMTIDPQRNGSLLDTALRMDHRCQAFARTHRPANEAISWPKVLLGFAPTRPPIFEDTIALRCEAAHRLGLRLDELGRNGSVLLDKLLRDVLESSCLQVDAPFNKTGNLLVPAAFCPSARGYLNVFEDFRGMLGVPTWNPVRDVSYSGYENPAAQIWTDLGFVSNPDMNQAFAPDLIRELERRMRSSVGEPAARLTKEDLLDGLTSPEAPLIAWSTLLPQLRRKLPSWAEPCCTDDDLKSAVRRPELPLWVRHACNVQVVNSDALDKQLGDAMRDEAAVLSVAMFERQVAGDAAARAFVAG